MGGDAVDGVEEAGERDAGARFFVGMAAGVCSSVEAWASASSNASLRSAVGCGGRGGGGGGGEGSEFSG